ncbi:MAG: hypothetical protein OXS47_02610 [Chloroflexota bacterium]|nr:hypothetical protein [Chloroflexota bacterium]
MAEERWEGVVDGFLRFVMAATVAGWLGEVAERGFREWAGQTDSEEALAALNELEMDKLGEGGAGEWAEGVNRNIEALDEPVRWFVVAAMLRRSTEGELRLLMLPVELARWLLGVADRRYEAWSEEASTSEFATAMAEVGPGMFGAVEVSEPIRWFTVSSAIRGSFDRGT